MRDLYDYVILRVVAGSTAFGLNQEGSDVDRRGVYLPPADMQWSLDGVPEQLENDNEEVYWELQKCIRMALKANPNVLETLYSPLIETVTPIGEELLAVRSIFLSKRVHQTFSAYARSQFQKIDQDLRNHGEVRWKHVMHLMRLLLSGVTVLREGYVPVRVERYRDELLAIRRGEMAWAEIDRWRLALHDEMDAALSATALPDEPDRARANAFLIRARRAASKPDWGG